MTAEPKRERSDHLDLRLAMHLSWFMAVVGAVALALGIAAVPIAGAYCPGECIDYPYLETVDRFPRDYLWIYVAVVLVIAYLLFMISLRAVAASDSILGQMSVYVAVAATVVLAATYFTQVTVVPASLAAGETEGIALLTMYNPHGLFIALEEIGYLLMSLSFLFAALMLAGDGRMMRVIRWIFAAGFAVPVLALVAYAVSYGLDRQYRFEVVAIATDWLVLIVNGVLVAMILRRWRNAAIRPAR